MSGERRPMGLYKRGLEAFGRSAVGDWYLKKGRSAEPPPAAALRLRAAG